MSMKSKNQEIVKRIRAEIAQRGKFDKLDVFPVENTFTRRQRYWNDGIINLFKDLYALCYRDGTRIQWSCQKIPNDSITKARSASHGFCYKE